MCEKWLFEGRCMTLVVHYFNLSAHEIMNNNCSLCNLSTSTNSSTFNTRLLVPFCMILFDRLINRVFISCRWDCYIFSEITDELFSSYEPINDFADHGGKKLPKSHAEDCGGDLFFKRVSLSSTHPSVADTEQYQVTRAGSHWTDQRLRSLLSSACLLFPAVINFRNIDLKT